MNLLDLLAQEALKEIMSRIQQRYSGKTIITIDWETGQPEIVEVKEAA